MNNIYNQTIVISIILLFIGVSVSSATTNVVKQRVINDNQPPTPPDIFGPTTIPVGKDIALTFNAVDPDGDNVSYYVEWGDGTSYGWTDYIQSGQDITIAHTWDKVNCDNIIRAKAKDIHGNESDWGYRDIPIFNCNDCDCEEISKSDLIKVEMLLDRVEVYGKLLMVLSRYNPELKEMSEELSNRITNLKEGLTDEPPFPIICGILVGIISALETIDSSISDWLESTEPGSIAWGIAWLCWYLFFPFAYTIYLPLFMIGVLFGCWEWDPYPPLN